MSQNLLPQGSCHSLSCCRRPCNVCHHFLHSPSASAFPLHLHSTAPRTSDTRTSSPIYVWMPRPSNPLKIESSHPSASFTSVILTPCRCLDGNAGDAVPLDAAYQRGAASALHGHPQQQLRLEYHPVHHDLLHRLPHLHHLGHQHGRPELPLGNHHTFGGCDDSETKLLDRCWCWAESLLTQAKIGHSLRAGGQYGWDV